MSTVAEAPKKQLTIRDHLNSEGMKNHLKMALPKHLTPDRMVRVALTAMTRTPKLAECDQASFFQALFQCSQWGLEPDGRRAHLIPFENKRKGIVECQLIIDYKGLAELAYRSGIVKSINAAEVRDGDIFEYDCGRVVRHVPHFLRRDPGKPASSGEVYAYYASAEMGNGATATQVMSLEEVNAIRDKSQGYMSFKKGYAKSSIWIDHPHEMGKKTVFKRLSKWLPLSADFRSAVEHDDGDYVEHVETHRTVDSISGLLAADDGVPQVDGETIKEDGEITPWDQETVETRFNACKTESEVAKLADELMQLYPDKGSDVGGYEDAMKTALANKAKPKGKGGELPLKP